MTAAHRTASRIDTRRPHRRLVWLATAPYERPQAKWTPTQSFWRLADDSQRVRKASPPFSRAGVHLAGGRSSSREWPDVVPV